MLKFGQIGVTLVSHYFHDTACALRGSGGAEGMVHTQGDGK